MSEKLIKLTDPKILYHPRDRVVLPESYTVVTLSTMPRSGTWFTYYLFENLNKILQQASGVCSKHGLEIYPYLKLVKVHVHSTSVGFEKVCNAELLEKWKKLNFVIQGYEYGDQFLNHNSEIFSLVKNSNAKQIYVFRNPMDQIVSCYFHSLKSISDEQRAIFKKFGDVKGFFYSGGLESYIKQYFTFHTMAEKFPDRVLLVRYENLKVKTKSTFEEMLKFCNVDIESEGMDYAIARAMEKSSVDKLKSIEKKQGESLAGDQVGKNQSHFKGGEVGKWKQHLGDDEIKIAKEKFTEFGIDFSGFVTE